MRGRRPLNRGDWEYWAQIAKVSLLAFIMVALPFESHLILFLGQIAIAILIYHEMIKFFKMTWVITDDTYDIVYNIMQLKRFVMSRSRAMITFLMRYRQHLLYLKTRELLIIKQIKEVKKKASETILKKFLKNDLNILLGKFVEIFRTIWRTLIEQTFSSFSMKNIKFKSDPLTKSFRSSLTPNLSSKMVWAKKYLNSIKSVVTFSFRRMCNPYSLLFLFN